MAERATEDIAARPQSRGGATRRSVMAGLAGLAAVPVLARAGAAAVPPPPMPCTPGTPGTPSQTEGPYYTPSTPRRAVLREPGSGGERLVFAGRVLTPLCRPVPGVTVDIWHSDERGRYDNAGFRYRGHQVTDATGAFRFDTVRPGAYPGRTPHIHVKLWGAGRRVLTTQLYFPDLPHDNAADALYREALLVRLERRGIWRARFDFVLPPG